MTTTSKHSTGRTLAVLAAIAPLVIGAFVFVRWLRGPEVTIGVEGRRVVEIAGPQLTAAPFTPGDAVSLRIDSAEPTPDGYRYDLRYMLFGPGKRNLAENLVRADGGKLSARSDLEVSVDALLPAKHSGELFATANSTINLHSGYLPTMRLLWGLWAAALVPLAWYGHKRRKRRAPPPPAPTLAEQLRALLERAVREPLSVEEQADLEQVFLAFWSRKLNLSTERLSEAVAELRKHPQGGSQLNRIERWLHARPTSAAHGTANELLHELGFQRN